MFFEENQSGTLHFTVFNEIEKNILNGTYKSGEQLTEKKLSEDKQQNPKIINYNSN